VAVLGIWVVSRVRGSGFRVQGSEFRVPSFGFKVQGSGFRVRFRVPTVLELVVVLELGCWLSVEWFRPGVRCSEFRRGAWRGCVAP